MIDSECSRVQVSPISAHSCGSLLMITADQVAVRVCPPKPRDEQLDPGFLVDPSESTVRLTEPDRGTRAAIAPQQCRSVDCSLRVVWAVSTGDGAAKYAHQHQLAVHLRQRLRAHRLSGAPSLLLLLQRIIRGAR